MPTRRAETARTHRARWLTAACLVATAALAQGGCMTSFSDYIHNCFKMGPNYHQPPTPVAKTWIDEGKDWVKLPEPTLTALREAGVSEPVVKKITFLLNKVFATREDAAREFDKVAADALNGVDRRYGTDEEKEQARKREERMRQELERARKMVLNQLQLKPSLPLGKPNLATWWAVFGDPALDDLIKRCYASNLTLRAAGFQILAAEKERYIAFSELLPQSQTGAFSYTRTEISRNGGAAVGPGIVFGTSLAPPGVITPVTTPTTPIAGVLPDPTGATTTGKNSAVSTAGGFAAATGPGRFFDNWATSLNFSWELDFWGLFRRNLEAASAALDQSVFNFDEMAVLLLANAATQYVEIRTLQRRLELARRNVAQQEPLVLALRQRFEVGTVNSDPAYHQLLSNLDNTRALIPPLEASLRQANNELCNLLGIPIQDLIPCLGEGRVPEPEGRVALTDRSLAALREAGVPESVLTKLNTLANKEFDNREALAERLPIEFLANALREVELNKRLSEKEKKEAGKRVREWVQKELERYQDLVVKQAEPVVRIPRPIDYAVVVDIPAAVLLQRPDVKASEQQLKIEAAEIGIAEAEMFPHIGINGSIGLAANQFSRLFSTGSQTGTIGPSLTWNILNYGRLLANVRLQNDIYKQEVAEYQQAILNANQDAENALIAYLESIDQARYLKESADAAARVTDYYINQLRTGYLPPGATDSSAFFTTLFTAINFQVTQQDLAAQAEGNVALNLILLYRALGGGWQLRLNHDKICPTLADVGGGHRPTLGLETAPEPAPGGSRPGTPPEEKPEQLPPPRKGVTLELDDH